MAVLPGPSIFAISTTHLSSMSLAMPPMRSSREAPPPPPVLGCMDNTIEKLISVSAIAHVMLAFSCMPNTFGGGLRCSSVLGQARRNRRLGEFRNFLPFATIAWSDSCELHLDCIWRTTQFATSASKLLLRHIPPNQERIRASNPPLNLQPSLPYAYEGRI